MSVESLSERCISKTLKERGAEDSDHLTYEILNDLNKYGFFIAFMSKCWCEGKETGSEHTPDCAGINQDQMLRELVQ